MSYHFQPSPLARRQAPPVYALPVPLSQVPGLAPVPSTGDRLAQIVAAVVGLLVVLWIIDMVMKQMASKRTITRNKAVKKATTAELATRLYARLEKRGGTSPATLRSLQSYANQ